MEESSYHLDSKYLSGPLANLREGHFEILEFYKNNAIRIGYVGVSRAGKNRSVMELVYTLGGIYQEEKERGGSNSGRTKKDSSILFGEFYEDGQRKTSKIRLFTNPGHRINDVSSLIEIPKSRRVVTLRNLPSMLISGQLSRIEEIMAKEGLVMNGCPALVTSSVDEAALPKHRYAQLMSAGFSRLYFTDNYKKRKYELSEFNAVNAEVLLDVLREKNPTFKLIYFGNEEIPSGLDDFLVRFDDHLETRELDDEDESIDEELSPEERLLQAIFNPGGKDLFV